MDNAEALDLIARYLSPHRAAAYQTAGLDFVQGRREGVWVHDLDGRELLNCRSAGGIFNFGHRAPWAAEALSDALREHDLGEGVLPSARRAQAAAALARLLPEPLRYSFFTVSGAEAVEVACKLARAVTGRPGLVSAEEGFHGHVGFSLAMAAPHLREHYEPVVPGITRVPFGDLAAAEAAVGDDTAAVIMETIPSTGGCLLPPPDFFRGLRRLCDERGALLILDEVQAGLCRTGRVWACEHFGVVPDLLLTGKGLSAGVYPISACCFGERVEAYFEHNPVFHPSSFAGSEIAALVVVAAVERYANPALPERVSAAGERLGAALGELVERHPDRLVEHRGLGLMHALETHSPEQGIELMQQCLAHGLLAIIAAGRPQALQVMPPLVISDAELDELLARLGGAVAATTGERRPALASTDR